MGFYSDSMGFFIVIQKATGWGPQDSVQLVYKWLNSMVYGRYNYNEWWL